MACLTQDEIVSRTRTVLQGLESLKTENSQLLSNLNAAAKAEESDNITNEKITLVKKSAEAMELGISEAQVRLLCLVFVVIITVIFIVFRIFLAALSCIF